MVKKIILFMAGLSVCFSSFGQSLDTVIVKHLTKGWNLVGYMGQNPEDTEEAFSSIMDNIEMIKTLDGFYTPEIKAYLSSLPTVAPLDGVLIKVTDSCTLKRTVKKSAILYYDNEEDPVFSAHPASDITADDIAMWDSKLSTELDGSTSNEIQDLSLTGNILTITNNAGATAIDLSKYLDNTDTKLGETEVDAMVGNNGYLTAELDGSVSNEIQDLSLTGNTLTITNNTGATAIDLSKYLDNTDTKLSETEVDAMVGNNGYLTAELDPVFADSPASDITEADILNLSNLSGTNKGDQDISGIAINEQAIQDSARQLRADIPYVKKYAVGDFAQGGVVMWVDETGQHGLVCSKEDLTDYMGTEWNNVDFLYTGAQGGGLYAGEMNTTLIVLAQGAFIEDYAAGLCSKYTAELNGVTYGDWYLPSVYELNIIADNSELIETVSLANGGSVFEGSFYGNGHYWSSTEIDDGTAYSIVFSNGNEGQSLKSDRLAVRAVRSF